MSNRTQEPARRHDRRRRLLELACALLIVTLTALFFGGPIAREIEANNDSVRDIWRARMLVELGIVPAHGPTITALPFQLGPGYYFLIAPAIWMSASPWSVYALHVGLFALGLAAIYFVMSRTTNPWSAATGLLLLASSMYAHSALDRLWHTAAIPGLSLLWCVALYGAVASERPTSRARSLALLWALQLLMLQVHLICAAYAPVTGLVQLAHWRRERWRDAPVAGTIASLFAAGTTGGYLWLILGADWSAAMSEQSQAGAHEGGGLGASLSTMAALLVNGWTHPAIVVLPAVVVGLVCLGIASALRRREAAPRWGLDRWLVVQLATGLPYVLLVARGGAFPRYFSGVMPGLYVLAAFGLGAVMVKAPRWVGPVLLALTLHATAIGLPSGDDVPHRDLVPLTLGEQIDAVDVIASHFGATPITFHRRVHGPLMWDTVAPYAALGRGDPNPPSPLGLDEHLTVVTPGIPEPAYGIERLRFEGGAGRQLTVVRHKARIDYDRVAAWAGETPCPLVLPYVWAPHPSPEELKAFDQWPTPQLTSCQRGDGPGALTLKIDAVRGDAPLTLMLAWLDRRLVGGRDARVLARDANGRPLTVTAMEGRELVVYAVYAISVAAGQPIEIEITPLRSLAMIDIY